ncbi:MAG: phosphate/phosphite/phosphonate ABC transporter substrate-binding protein [Nitrospiraceae bacterium]|nr:MAG: phosphate/phosphite/phosphonate ABC transporter substrate-binding protein [Nitrospiraceae bacterium]
MLLKSLAILLLLISFSCSNNPSDIDSVEPKKIRERALTIAILPEQNVFEQRKKYSPLAEYLSNALDMNVKIKLLDSYGSIYDEIKNKTIDGAFFGSFNYVLTKARADIEPIARAVGTDGKSTYRGLMFTRKDTGLTGDVRALKGKSIALVHEVTTAGYIYPVWYLKKHGVNNFEQYFSKITFTGSHDAAILAVFKGQADIGAAKNLIYEKLLSEHPDIKDKLTVIASSIEVPSNTLCVRGDLDPGIKISLKEVLLSMHTSPDGKDTLGALNASGFEETADSEFDELRTMAKELDIDIKIYPFRHNR